MELELQVSRQSSGRRDLAAMMQQPSGAHLTKASSKEGLNQTEAKLQTLERHLKIKIRWKPEDREYQVCFSLYVGCDAKRRSGLYRTALLYSANDKQLNISRFPNILTSH